MSPSLICIYYRDRFVLAQVCEWGGFPQEKGHGMEILKFLWEPGNIERLREGLQHVATLTKEGQKQLLDTIFHDLESELALRDPPFLRFSRGQIYESADCNMLAAWPSLSGDTGAGILKIITQATAEKHVPILLGLSFANTHGCRWAYVLDLDQNVFEVFGDIETKQEASTTRFNDVGGEYDTVPAFLQSFSFAELPATGKDFMRVLKTAMKEKDNNAYGEFLRYREFFKSHKREIASDPSCVSEDSDDEMEIDEEGQTPAV
jgi:hypothetical protein